MPDAANSSPRKRGERETRAPRPDSGLGAEEATSTGHYRAATQDKLGQALSDLLENPLVTGAIGRAWGAREKAAQAQELWMGALNIPSAADIERLTRRLRSVSQRLEGVEDGVQRLGRTIIQSTGVDARLATIDERLATMSEELREVREAMLALAASGQGGAGAHASAGPSTSGATPRRRSPAGARARAKR